MDTWYRRRQPRQTRGFGQAVIALVLAAHLGLLSTPALAFQVDDQSSAADADQTLSDPDEPAAEGESPSATLTDAEDDDGATDAAMEADEDGSADAAMEDDDGSADADMEADEDSSADAAMEADEDSSADAAMEADEDGSASADMEDEDGSASADMEDEDGSADADMETTSPATFTPTLGAMLLLALAALLAGLLAVVREPARMAARVQVVLAWRRDWGGLLVLASGLLLVALGISMATIPTDSLTATVVGDLVPLPIGLAAALAAWRAGASVGLDRRTRWAWRFLSLAALSYMAGDLAWAVDELAFNHVEFPALPDVGYLAFYPLLLVGLLTFPVAPRTRADRLKFILDAATVVLGGALVIWHFVLRPIAQAEHSEVLASVVAGIYPIGDLVLVYGVAAILLRRPGHSSRTSLTIVTAGLGLFVAGDLLYGPKILDDTYDSGGWVDLFWVAGQFLLLVGAHVQHWRARHPSTALAPEEVRVSASSSLPYISVAVAYGLLLLTGADQFGTSLGDMMLGAVALTAIVVIRQVAALRENAHLLEERATRQSEMRFRSLVQRASDVFSVVEPDGTIVYQSPAMLRVFGYPPEELARRSFLDLLHPLDRGAVVSLLAEAAAAPEGSASGESRLQHHDGTWRTVEIVVSNLLHDPHVHGLVLNSRDITERKLLEEQLVHQAFHDGLTNLPNRALFHGRVVDALERTRSGLQIGLGLVDLDNFKAVNDTWGHAAGDAVLVAVADRLRGCLRPGEAVARLGGDEFALLIESADHTTLPELASRVAIALSPPFAYDSAEVSISASLGFTVSGSEHKTRDELLREADVALYVAKSHGRGHAELFEPAMHDAILDRLRLAADLRQAVERDEFYLQYQPQVALKDGALLGFEALVRWHHPERGLIAPLDFIPLAEETGLIVPLGRWVLREACRQAGAWQAQFPHRTFELSVNLSGFQLEQDDIVAEVATILHESGLPPQTLVLELTESALMRNTDATLTKLHQLKALGVRLALDDFGTGYSSLSYLQQFPIDILKIDKAFVDHLASAEESRALVRAIVALAGALRVETLAEGIEESDQHHILNALECRYGQGYLFDRPLDVPAVQLLLAAQPTAATADSRHLRSA